MGRLFWKIFLWFWVALLLITGSVSWGVKLYLESARDDLRKHIPRAQIAAVRLALSRDGEESARMTLRELNDTGEFPIFVLDRYGEDILHRPIPPHLRHRHRDPETGRRLAIRKPVMAPDGQRYMIVAPAPNWHHKPPWLQATPRWVSITIALIISTLVCFWLARYLTRPVQLLRTASGRMAAGDLKARVGSLGGRRDEIADLAAEFDLMAERIQNLLGAQRQLLTDVSHELRSPLARLQVALALARRRTRVSGQADLPELDRIEREIQRLDDLVGQALTLSRLETSGIDTRGEHVELAELLEEIVADVTYEARQKPCSIRLGIQGRPKIEGNSELLRRAIENVIRNAMHYTGKNTDISVTLVDQQQGILLTVCDRGPGVPESALPRLFDAFFRTDAARERNTGGQGLGLAIASRAVKAHGGTIAAYNRDDGPGLCVEIKLRKGSNETP